MKVFAFAAVLALPVAAQAPTFVVAVECDGPVPVVIEVRASREGAMRVRLDDLFAFCAAAAPQKQGWRTGS